MATTMSIKVTNEDILRARIPPTVHVVDSIAAFSSVPKTAIKICEEPYITNVIFNNPATIVFWSDFTKTVVKCNDQESYDPEKGLVMCIAKKMFGNKGNYYNKLRKWLKNA